MSDRLLRIDALNLPKGLPIPEAMKAFGGGAHEYDPEQWSFQYNFSQHLNGLNDAALHARHAAIVRNMQALTSADRDVIPARSFLSSWYWYRKEHQTRYALAMRGQAPRIVLPQEPALMTNRNAPVRAASPGDAEILYRYTKMQYATEMIEKGRILVNAASSMAKLEGDRARYDLELNKSSFIPRDHARITLADGRPIKVLGDVRRTVSLPNYYMFCVARDWDPALFDDFGADACVIIKDRDAFVERANKAAANVLPGWDLHDLPVEYFDPYEVLPKQHIDAGMSKSFEYAYQREYRFLWFHPARAAQENVFLELGPLGDIAELHAKP